MTTGNIPQREWVKLADVANSVAADSLDTLLQSFEIPTLVRPSGAGGYMEVYMGSTNLGVEILVPDDEFERAQEIVAAYASGNYEGGGAEIAGESYDEPDSTGGANPERKISAVKWYIRIGVALVICGFAYVTYLQVTGAGT